MISIDEALNIIIKETKVVGAETVDLLSSLNKVLGENIYSRDNLPPFDKSAMDGYAIKCEDTRECNGGHAIQLNVKGLIKAGEFYEGELKFGEALKIMTGAPLPKGADAVIQIEKVLATEDKVTISDYVKKDTNIIKMGEEIQVGDLAIETGKVIRPVEIGLLASLGYSNLKVYRTPKIAIIATGDELVNIDSELPKGKIRNSNEYSLLTLCKSLGAEALSFGVVNDEKEALKEKIISAFEKADIVITSGGVSAGDYDFIEDVLKEMGAEVKFNSVAIKPGKPIIFAVLKDKLFFGLPGNPLAAITTFDEFVKLTILKMMGYKDFQNEWLSIIAGSNFKGKKDRRKYIYVQLINEDGKYYAYDIGSQSSNHLMTMSRANGIIIMPDGVNRIEVGEVVDGRFICRK